jgi:AI-2 transport protein TqsA
VQPRMDQLEKTDSTAGGWWQRSGVLLQLAIYLVILSASWYLLKELAPLLRPLLLAMLLAYIILPIHSRLHRGRSEMATIVIMTVGAVGIGAAITVIAYGSVLQMNDELPRLTRRFDEIVDGFQRWSAGNLPPWANRTVAEAIRAESHGSRLSQQAGQAVLAYSANMLLEAAVVGLYLIFIIVEARRLPHQVRKNFNSAWAEHILQTVGVINERIGRYLKTKTKTSAALALPVVIVLLVFNVKFAFIWGVLTFVCNFIPYIGSVIGCGTPIVFAFLDLPLDWKPFAVAGLLLAIHIASAAFVEPTWIGNAVRLRPLVILMSMTFWGLCWGIVGVLLAVPLTVTLRIILENIEPTKPIARFFGD